MAPRSHELKREIRDLTPGYHGGNGGTSCLGVGLLAKILLTLRGEPTDFQNRSRIRNQHDRLSIRQTVADEVGFQYETESDLGRDYNNGELEQIRDDLREAQGLCRGCGREVTLMGNGRCGHCQEPDGGEA